MLIYEFKHFTDAGFACKHIVFSQGRVILHCVIIYLNISEEGSKMLGTIILVAALSVNTLTDTELETYYWDCDTAFMKGDLGGADLNSCLAVTEELQQRKFDNNREAFMQWWRTYNLPEWYKRGFTPRVDDLPKLRYKT